MKYAKPRIVTAAFVVVLIAMLAPSGVGQQQPEITMSDAKTVSIRSDNVELISILHCFSELGDVNIIAGQDVTGTVSVNLTDVPFEEALTAILGVAGFTHYKVGSIIYVTSEARKAELPVAVSDLTIKSFRIDYVQPEEMRVTVADLLSPSGKVWLNAGDLLVVQDAPAYLSQIENLISEVDIPPLQVLISAKLINIDRDDNLNIGVGFDTAPFSAGGLEVLTSGFATPFPFGADELAATSTGLFAGTLQNGFKVFIEALEEYSDVEILASPEILVVDRETARIQVGEKLGFRITTTTETASLESVEFLEVGTVLEVTPFISDDGLIRLEVSPKVSTGVISSTGLPSESTTEITTTMLIGDGQTIVIGGLLNATRQRIRSQIPFLGDLPFIGGLFGRRRWIDNKSEVVVLLTPHIVGPIPSAGMKRHVEAAEGRWGRFSDRGLIDEGTPLLKDSPTAKWGNLIRREGRYQLDTEDGDR